VRSSGEHVRDVTSRPDACTHSAAARAMSRPAELSG
jgi:hypothetical protein